MARITSNKSVKELLDAQPKATIFIPPTPDVAPEADYRVVRINGYGYKVMAGEHVEVPQSVADILMNSNKAISQINKKYADMTIGGGRKLNTTSLED